MRPESDREIMNRARLKHPRHTGLSRAIREELARSKGPMSVYKLQVALSIKHAETVRAALTHLISNSGGVISMPGPKKGVRYYSIYTPPKPSSGSGNIAGRITIPSYRWGSTRLG